MATVPKPWLESPPALPPHVSSLPWCKELATARADGTPALVPLQGAGMEQRPPLWYQQRGRAWSASHEESHCLHWEATGSRHSQGHQGSPSPREQAPPWGQAEDRLGSGPAARPGSVGPWPGKEQGAGGWSYCGVGVIAAESCRVADVGFWALGRDGDPQGRLSLGAAHPAASQ